MADVSKFKIGTIIYNIKDAVARKVMKGAETNAAGEAGQVPAPEAGAANRYLRSDGTWQVPPDTNTTYGNMAGANTSAAGKAGLVPAPGAGAANRYLRSDGSWQVPPDTNTTYGNMTAATANAAGRAGLVPAPGAGAQGKYLRGDGTWQTPPDTNTVYTHPSTHPASMISQDASHRFVTDTEKTAWNGKVNTSDIINNCTSTATNKPLSAAQGKALWDKYTQLNGDFNNIGAQYWSSAESISLSAAVWKSGSKSITLPAGTYIIIAHGEMPVGNYTAYLAIDGIDIWEQCISFPVTSNDYRRATVSVFHHFTQQKTLKAKFLSQQAVTAINCEICAVRIK